ncbi:MAG TPA: hypothetical protein VHE77_00455 [Dongiaceae bacterium]|nr:hypothetical protein [Dongiaceae bacterium]
MDRGRQLFIDDHLIAFTSFNRTFHRPAVSPDSPVLSPETPLERNRGIMPASVLFSDGVWFDPDDRLFKIWYMAGYDDGFAYAYSEDGIRWTRPSLDLVPGTNRILPKIPGFCRNGSTVWLDHDAARREERFKMFVYLRRTDGLWPRGNPAPLPAKPEMGHIYTSGDGIHWDFRGETGPCGDNSGAFYNPFCRKWVFSVRTKSPLIGRTRSYFAHSDFVEGRHWTLDDLQPLAAADSRDRPDPDLQYRPELYKLDCVAYESVMIGLFGIYFGPPNEISYKVGVPKTIDLFLGVSRDGFNWERPSRDAFLACSRIAGTWNKGYLHAAGGLCTVIGDTLRFYFSGFSGISPAQGSGPYAGASVGYATLRRDGFASMDGPGRPMQVVANAPLRELTELANDRARQAIGQAGLLVTHPLSFSGAHLYVNAKTELVGVLRVALLDANGASIPGFDFDDCVPIMGDSTKHAVRWGAGDLGRFAGEPVRLAFMVDAGSLYSFWISPSADGASRGFVAAGGPGFAGATDTTGA